MLGLFSNIKWRPSGWFPHVESPREKRLLLSRAIWHGNRQARNHADFFVTRIVIHMDGGFPAFSGSLLLQASLLFLASLLLQFSSLLLVNPMLLASLLLQTSDCPSLLLLAYQQLRRSFCCGASLLLRRPCCKRDWATRWKSNIHRFKYKTVLVFGFLRCSYD